MINRPLAYIWKAWCLLYISLHVKKRRLFNSLQNFHGSFFATNLSKRKFCKVEKEVVKKEEKAAAFCRCRHKSRVSNQLYISLITFFFFSRKIDSTLDLLYSECTLAQCVYISLNRLRQYFLMSEFKIRKINIQDRLCSYWVMSIVTFFPPLTLSAHV